MKRTLLAIVATLMMTLSVSAQRLTDITAEARFITDKMIVELGLNSIQRSSILQLNLNYLNGINGYRDIDAYGWKYRNKQLKKMLTAKQWKLYKNASYFYRPISWRNNAYIHNIYVKYPKANYRPNGPRPGRDPRYNGFKNDKYNKKNFRNGKREFDNNSKEAIRMRQDMRKNMKRGAR